MTGRTRRLLDYGDDLNDVLRSALDAERSAPPDPDAARLAKIGAGIAARVGGPPPPPSHAAPKPTPTPTPTTVTGGLAAKAPFVLLAAATIAGLFAIGSMTHEGPRPAAPVVPAAPIEVRAPEPVAEPAPSEPGIALDALPNARVTPAKSAAPAKAEAEAEEIALIGRAHDALRSDPRRALALCKEHETTYAGGHFAQEREAVAIEALVYLNRKDDAARRFAEFDRKYPASSHRVHLESLLAR